MSERDPSPAIPQSAAQLEASIGHRFGDPTLLEAAMTHTSFLNEHPGISCPDNQRLEFLGDAVVQLVVSQTLVQLYPDEPEGQLTKMRSLVVSRTALAAAARRMELGLFLSLGRGEERSGGREKDSLLADAFEAMAGALFLDAGFAGAERVLLPLLQPALDALDGGGVLLDSKSRLQEFTQSRYLCAPVYLVIAEQGPDHAKDFLVHVVLGGCVWGVGPGPTKKAAEQVAAAQALVQFERLMARPGHLPALDAAPALAVLEEEARKSAPAGWLDSPQAPSPRPETPNTKPT